MHFLYIALTLGLIANAKQRQRPVKYSLDTSYHFPIVLYTCKTNTLCMTYHSYENRSKCNKSRRLKPIFHLKTGLRWMPDANEIYTKNMKCTCPTPAFCVGTQRNLYSTGWRRGLASGKTQMLALGNAKIYQRVGISNAKVWRRGHCPTPAPDARYFAFWWNIGFNIPCQFINLISINRQSCIYEKKGKKKSPNLVNW